MIELEEALSVRYEHELCPLHEITVVESVGEWMVASLHESSALHNTVQLDEQYISEFVHPFSEEQCTVQSSEGEQSIVP